LSYLEEQQNILKVLNNGYVRLVNVMGSDIDVANSARVSYDKESSLNEDRSLKNKDTKLINFLWDSDHTSPFRHCVLSFEIYAPLMVARQHWKYTVASTFVDDQNGWNESSRRYITEEPAFYIPTADQWRSAPENSKQGSGEPINYGLGIELTMRLFNMIEAAEQDYQHALDIGVCAEQARLFLPAYGMYVRYRWTVSLHGLMHFLQQRLAHDAQVEIVEYAKALRSLAEKEFPYCIGLIK
jgi:thymidylate synthase (FAD)